MGIITDNTLFSRHRKSDAVINFTKFGNLLAVARFLFAEIIAWNANNNKAAILEPLIEFLQAAILTSKTTF